MAEYAPAAIRGLYNLIKAGLPSAEMSGIIGDTAHTYGYHRCRNVVPVATTHASTASTSRAMDGPRRRWT